MKSNYILQSACAFALAAGLVACGGGDRHGANTSPNATALEGLWMAEGAYADFTNDPQFCESVKQHPSRHGLVMWRYGIPGVRILKITHDGDVFRWSPSLRLGDPQFSVRGYYVGRVGVDGVPTGNTYGTVIGDGMGSLRLIDPSHLAQVAGDNPFRVTQRNNKGQLIELRDRDLDFTFVRVSDAQAGRYLERLRACEPRYFGDRQDYVPHADPRPVDPRPVATRPSQNAPARTPEPIAPTGGYIPDDAN